jgi:CheY-like chemotaxis protein
MGKILIMDDEDMIRDVTGRMLIRLGYEVAFARDGLEAIAAYTEARNSGKPFDLVMMDLTVRDGMGGKEALQQIRLIDPGVKAIVSSGHANDPIMSDYALNGFMGAVAKPYTMKMLGEALQQILGNTGLRHPL